MPKIHWFLPGNPKLVRGKYSNLILLGMGLSPPSVHLLEILEHLRHRLAGRGAHSYF